MSAYPSCVSASEIGRQNRFCAVMANVKPCTKNSPFCLSRWALVVGVKDKTGSVNPLSYLEVQETTNTLGNIASENVVPAILVDVETIPVDGGSLVVAHIKEGVNKPYHDNRGIVWVKNGADKRKVFRLHGGA